MESLSLHNIAASISLPKGQVCLAKLLTVDLLREMPLFHNLRDEHLSGLKELLHISCHPTGTIIIRAEQPGERAYIILTGTVKVQVEQGNGKNVILAILGHGQLIGEMSLTDSLDCSATVVTLEESHFLWIDREHFQSCLRTIPQLQHNLNRLLSARLRLANAQLQALAALDAPGRVARQLLAFAKEYGAQVETGIVIPLRLTQDDLADLVGASRVHVNRVLNDYKRRGIVTIDQRHYITIHASASLQERCI